MVESASNRLKGKPRFRNFLVVVDETRNVTRLIASPSEKLGNIDAIDLAVPEVFRELSEQSRHTGDQVYLLRAPYAAIMQKSTFLKGVTGWETAQRELLKIR